MALTRILLIGGTGNLGTLILQHLLASSSNYTVSVLSRRSANTSQYPSTVKTIQVDDDYPLAQITPAFSNIDVVISAISMAGMHHQPKFIDACVAAHVKRYIPTEFGLEDLPQWLLDLRPMFKTKHDVRDYLVEKESEGLSWTCVCCNVFFEMGIESGFFQFYWDEKKAVLLDDGELKWPATTLDTVAMAVTKVIEKEEQTKNKILLIRDFMTSQKEVLQEIEKRTGKWDVQKRDLSSWLEEAKEKTKNGQNEELSKLTFAVAREAGDWGKREEFANALLDLPTKSFGEAIGQALKERGGKEQ
jgi:putative NADH-flavin reductase